MMPLFIEALNASLIGVLSSVLLWMWCHRRMYVWRDFGIVLLLLTSVLIRLTHPNPPENHFVGIMLLNVIFVLVAALVWARPSRIPAGDRANKCIIFRVLSNLWRLISGSTTLEYQNPVTRKGL